MFTQFWAFVARRLSVLRIIFLGLPALLVLVWLPLLGIGVIGTRALRALLRTVRWAQWFIKQGNQRPLEAIGLVAAAVVFVITAVIGLLTAPPASGKSTAWPNPPAKPPAPPKQPPRLDSALPTCARFSLPSASNINPPWLLQRTLCAAERPSPHRPPDRSRCSDQ